MTFNPSANIGVVEPTEFEPGRNIDIDVNVHASNPDRNWNTCIVVTRQDTGDVYCKPHKMIAASDDFVEPIVCGSMPDGTVRLKIQTWGHPDYWPSPSKPEVC